MRQLHDRIYGEGTGRRFLRGDYLDDLPRAVRERISSEIDVDKSRANRGNGPRIWERDTLTNGANLKVVNVNANDVLMMREYPTENSRVVYTVPPDETGIVYQGEERGQWVFVEYERARGWVKRLFVQPLPSRGGRF